MLHRPSIELFLVGVLVLITMAGQALAASEQEGDQAFEPHHHIAGILGYAFERKRGKDEEAGAIGIDYGYRFSERWGAGGFIEALGDDVVRDVSLGLIANWHPAEGLALFAGPGFEFTEKDDEWLLRIGAGYDFHLQNGWVLGPKLTYDMISGGKRTTILALSLGKEF